MVTLATPPPGLPAGTPHRIRPTQLFRMTVVMGVITGEQGSANLDPARDATTSVAAAGTLVRLRPLLTLRTGAGTAGAVATSPVSLKPYRNRTCLDN